MKSNIDWRKGLVARFGIRGVIKKNLTFILFLITFVCSGETTKVSRVIDGDTFETDAGEKVRLIGINAPEISDIFGIEAKKYLSELVEKKTVDLKCDKISNDRDRYQRLLRYVILDGVDINKKMVSDGMAFAYQKFRFSNSLDYEKAQLEAKKNNKGIWGDNEKVSVFSTRERYSIITRLHLSSKAYVIGSLVILLVIIGIYSKVNK